MFVRSLILQLTFFLALMAASRLGTEALAAHAVIGQLWVTVSYAVDGFAAAGIVLGSRLAAQARDPLLAPGAKRCGGCGGWPCLLGTSKVGFQSATLTLFSTHLAAAGACSG